MKTTGRGLAWVGVMVLGWLFAASSPALAGKLEDLLLENKQITIDQWVQLKAEEEKREAKEMEQSRGVGDVPVRERWYEKISIRGYTQFRSNFTRNNDFLTSPGDRAIDGKDQFSLRRVRLIVFVYLQGEFAGLVNNQQGTAGVSTAYAQEGTAVWRDAYADIFLTPNKEWRIRPGLSKVPFGFETVQSSQNRLALDRNDATFSTVPNERSLGVFLYYTPTTVRERFRRLVESGLKGSGDYGMLGIGVYNGQNIDQRDANKNKHVIFHSSYPHEFANGQIVEVGMDAYTGQIVVSTTPVVPTNSTDGVPVSPLATNGGNYLDERVAWHMVVFPQPFGFQAEYSIGRGPQLNQARTAVELGSLRGGYVQLYYNYKCDTYCQNIFPYVRMQEYFGGLKLADNAPRQSVRETELGIEYQFNRSLELTVAYSWTQRTSGQSATLPANSFCGTSGSQVSCFQSPYQLQTGNLIRFQLQWSF